MNQEDMNFTAKFKRTSFAEPSKSISASMDVRLT